MHNTTKRINLANEDEWGYPCLCFSFQENITTTGRQLRLLKCHCRFVITIYLHCHGGICCTLPLFHLKLNGLPRHQVASHPTPSGTSLLYPHIHPTLILSQPPLSLSPSYPLSLLLLLSLSPPSQKRTRKVVRCLLEHAVHAGTNPCGSSVRQQVNTGSHSTTTGECHLNKNML